MVSYETGMQFARDNQMLFIETSAMNGDHINEAFDLLVNELTKLARFRSPPMSEITLDPRSL